MTKALLTRREFRRLGKEELGYVRFMTREEHARAFSRRQWPAEAGDSAFALCDGSGRIVTLGEDEELILEVAAGIEITAHRLN